VFADKGIKRSSRLGEHHAAAGFAEWYHMARYSLFHAIPGLFCSLERTPRGASVRSGPRIRFGTTTCHPVTARIERANRQAFGYIEGMVAIAEFRLLHSNIPADQPCPHP
jgi:hypothetical protein